MEGKCKREREVITTERVSERGVKMTEGERVCSIFQQCGQLSSFSLTHSFSLMDDQGWRGQQQEAGESLESQSVLRALRTSGLVVLSSQTVRSEGSRRAAPHWDPPSETPSFVSGHQRLPPGSIKHWSMRRAHTHPSAPPVAWTWAQLNNNDKALTHSATCYTFLKGPHSVFSLGFVSSPINIFHF